MFPFISVFFFLPKQSWTSSAQLSRKLNRHIHEVTKSWVQLQRLFKLLHLGASPICHVTSRGSGMDVCYLQNYFTLVQWVIQFYQCAYELTLCANNLSYPVFIPSSLQGTSSCYNLSHPSLSCRTGLCSFFSVPGTCWAPPDVICPGINNASSRCMSSFWNKSAGRGWHCIVLLFSQGKKVGEPKRKKERS